MNKIFFILLVFIISCKNQEKSIKLTDYASMIMVEKSKSNEKPKNGDYCLIEYVTEINDSTYDYSSDVNPLGVTMLFNDMEAANKGNNQFLLALKEMNAGDSVKIRMELSKEFVELNRKKKFPIREYIVTNLRFKKIMNQAEADAFNAAFSANAMKEYQQLIQKDSIVYNMILSYLPKLINGDKSDFSTLSSGAIYKIINPGNGTKPTGKDNVKFHISAVSLGGQKLGSSYKKAGPESINLNSGRLIPIIKDGLSQIGEGGSIIIYAPSPNAIKEREKEILYFIEIVAIRKGF